MSKIFTWLFGATVGVIAGVTLVAGGMVMDPKAIISVAETFIDE